VEKVITVSDETRIVPHFTFKELANNESTELPKYKLETMEAVEHLQMIEELRMWAVRMYPDKFPNGLCVSSGFRNPKFNRKVGGASNSCHLDSRATDFNNIPQSCYLAFMYAWSTICSIHNKIGGVEYGRGYMHFDSYSDKFGYKKFRIVDKR
jgi:hypothetical protein